MAEKSIDLADKNSANRLIDNTSNLKGRPVFIQSGKKDEQYPRGYQFAQREFFNHFGANVQFEEWDVGHKVPSIFEQSEK